MTPFRDDGALVNSRVVMAELTLKGREAAGVFGIFSFKNVLFFCVKTPIWLNKYP